MNLVPFDLVSLRPGRQRQEFDDDKLNLLMESIKSKGLLHAPIAAFDGTKYELIAGERRFRAIKLLNQLDMGFTYDKHQIPPGVLPVTLLSDLSELSLREAEFEENEIRADLSWQERTHALAELHAIRTEQAAILGQHQTFQATATEVFAAPGTQAVGATISKVSEAVIIAKHLDDPDVSAAKTQKEAIKVIKKKAEAAHRAVLAQTFDQAKTPHTCHHGDSLVILPQLPSASVDVFVTDPPYGVNADQFGDMASTGHAYKDTPEYALGCYEKLSIEAFRIAKAEAAIYTFLDFKFWREVELLMQTAGWEVWPKPLIWAKGNGMLPKPDFGPRYTYEVIMYATKGSAKVKRVGLPDVIVIPNKQEFDHGAQKPVELYTNLLSRNVLPGMVVCDPFAGSGPIFPAATGLKVTAIGIELSEKNHHICLTRMGQTQDDPLQLP